LHQLRAQGGGRDARGGCFGWRDPRRDGDALDRDVGGRAAMDALEVAQMGGASGGDGLAIGPAAGTAAATGQALLLDKRRGRRPLCSLFVLYFLEISMKCQEIFLIFMIAGVLKSRIIST
jgi:hypothetical protein